MGQGVRGYLFLNDFKDDISGTYDDIYAQFLEDFFILWISDAGYGAGHIKFILGYLAGNQIIFIVSSYGN